MYVLSLYFMFRDVKGVAGDTRRRAGVVGGSCGGRENGSSEVNEALREALGWRTLHRK